MTSSELQKNMASYDAMKDELKKEYVGKVALFSNGELEDIFNDFADAYKIGMHRFGEGKYSIKRIGEQSYNLGFIGLMMRSCSEQVVT